MIIGEALTRAFGDVRAVDSMDIRVDDGSIVALLGPNGAGKTTTVRMLSGVLGITSGTARIDDVSVNDDPDGARARSGLLMGDAGLYETMRFGDYLSFFGETYGMTAGEAKERAQQLGHEVGLADRLGDKLATFSKGMKQRVALARALVNDPPALFLDEPTSGLDVEAAIEFRQRIAEFRHERRSIVLCTHVLEEAEQLADDVVVIKRGRVVARGPISELKRAGGGRTFEVQLAGDAAPFARALARTGATAVVADGSVLTFVSDDPERTNPAVVRALVRAKAGVVSIAERTRSLQQAYVDIVRGDDGP